MSTNDSDSRGRLSPRTVRVRNRCLAALASRRSLPAPTAAEMDALGDAVRLGEAWAQWQTGHTPANGAVEGPAPAAKRAAAKWRPRLIKMSALAAAAVLGFVVGDRWLPGAAAQSGDIAAAWLPVTDSVVAALNVKLSSVAASDVSARVTLTAADMAALVFRSPRRRQAPVDSVEARIDSVLWIRGRLRGGSRFELGGEIRMSRRGVAELLVEHLTIGGVDADSARTARLVVGVRARSTETERMRFDVPAVVAEVAIMGGAAELIARARR